MALLLDLLVSGQTRLNDDTYAKDIYADKFIRTGSSDLYVLLGGGGHKLLSDFSMAHDHPYLSLTGGTLTGPLTLAGERYQGNYALNLQNSNIVGVNAIFMNDIAEDAGEGLQFPRSNGKYDSIWVKNGEFYFSPDGSNSTQSGTYSTNYTVIHSGNYNKYLGYIGTSAVQKTSANQSLSGIINYDATGYIKTIGFYINVGAQIAQYSSTRTEFALINPNDAPSMLELGVSSERTWGIESRGSERGKDFSIYNWSASEHQFVISHENGFVGIKNTSPAYTLDVNGAGHFSGSLTTDGNLTVNGNSGYFKTYIFMNSGSNGVYLHTSGLSWHDSNNSYVNDLFTFSSNSITAYQPITVGDSNTYSLIGPGYIKLRNYDGVNPSFNKAAIEFSYHGGQEMYISYTPNDSYRSSKGLKIWGSSSDPSNPWLEVEGKVYGNGFVKHGSSSNYVLLGDGGHKLLSDFSMSHSHPYLPLSGGTMTGSIRMGINDLNFNGSDPGDIAWFDENGNETERIWSSKGSGSLYYRTKAGTTYTLYHSGNLTSLPANGGNADTVDNQHFSYSNDSNYPTYLWASNSNGSSFLAARGSISVNYANSAGSTSVWTRTWQRAHDCLADTTAYHNETRVYMYDSESTNSPAGGAGYIISHTWDWGEGTSLLAQTFDDADKGRLYTNTKPCGSNEWVGWKKIAFYDDIPVLTGGSAAETGKYVSGVTVSGHVVTVTKTSLPSIPTVTDYYWADQKISSELLTNTEPTVKALHIFPSGGNYNDGIRIHSRDTSNGWCAITFCASDATGKTGISADSWFMGVTGGNFYLGHGSTGAGNEHHLRSVSNAWECSGTWKQLSNFTTDGTLTTNGSVAYINGNCPSLYINNTNTNNDHFSIIRFGVNNNVNSACIFVNGPNRTNDGGKSMMTIRNNVGNLRLDNITNITGKLTGEAEVYFPLHATIGSDLSTYSSDRAEFDVVSKNDVPCDIWIGSSQTRFWYLSCRSSGEGRNMIIGKVGGAGNLNINSVTTFNGNVTAPAFYESSDERLKDFYNSIDVDLDKLSLLPKKFFKWKSNPNGEFEIGTSAQELQKIYPQLVNTDDKGYLTVAYDKLSIIALRAIDKLYEMNKNLERRIQNLESKL